MSIVIFKNFNFYFFLLQPTARYDPMERESQSSKL